MKNISRIRKGELPVPYIVALVIAAVVIIFLMYWFWTQGNTGINQATEVFCQGKLRTYCAQWATCGYQNSCQPKDKTGNGALFYTLDPDCKTFAGQPSGLPATVGPTDCAAALGLGTQTTSP